MHRLSILVLAVAACGGTPKPPPTAPLPDDTKQESKPPVAAKTEAEPKPAEPAPPPAPAGPIDITIPAVQPTVKVVTDGKGKKQALRYTAKQGAKQAVEVAIDFTGKQDADAQTVPTIVLTGEAETRTVAADGSTEYSLTVTGTDAREVAGSSVPLDKFKTVIASLAGLTIGGKRSANGAGDVTLHLEHPAEHATDALALVRETFPVLPVLPAQALGVGAKWQATTAAKLADKLDVTQVTDYEIVAHKGATWTIKGTTKVSGKDQTIDTAKISGISGTGTSETTISDGALYPSHKAQLETQFTASDADKSVQFAIKVAGAVTPR